MVAKESNPVALVEFGPKNSSSIGLNQQLSLNDDESFDRKTISTFRQDYQALALWELSTQGKCDFSDIEVARNKIFVLSQRCQKNSCIRSTTCGWSDTDTETDH